MKADLSLEPYLKLLLEVVPDAREVWLFGSRANGRERADSDWDLLLCAPRTQEVFEALATCEELHVASVQLFAPDPNIEGVYRVPWRLKESICPARMNWRRVTVREARYRGTKIDPGAPRSAGPFKGGDWPEGWIVREHEKAIRVWSKC